MGNSDSEDEIFFGPPGSKEKKIAKILGNRKTEVFKAPLLIRQQSTSMPPHEGDTRTYSKVPNVVTATEEERKQRIKQRPPPLPPFTQLYCNKDERSRKSQFRLLSRDGKSLNSPFHQTKKINSYLSNRSRIPLLSPHLLALPCQQLGRLSLSPGLSPSFYYDSFDKLLLHNGHVARSASFSPCPDAETCIYDTTCSSIEDIMSPAGLLFCSPMPPKPQYVSAKKQKKHPKTSIIRPSIIAQHGNDIQKHGKISKEPIPRKESTENDEQEISERISNINISIANNNVVRKTPDIFFTSSWITRRRNYGNIGLGNNMNNKSLISSTEKRKLRRSLSVPQITIMHPEESDSSFMTSSFTSNSRVSLHSEESIYDTEDTTSRIPIPSWMLTLASALNYSHSFSDSDISTYAQSPSPSDLCKTFDTISTLSPLFTKRISNIKKPLSNISTNIGNHN